MAVDSTYILVYSKQSFMAWINLQATSWPWSRIMIIGCFVDFVLEVLRIVNWYCETDVTVW